MKKLLGKENTSAIERNYPTFFSCFSYFKADTVFR